jgi:multidrug efflux pump subunit AcrA (membrane-fusion protein)
MQSFFSSSAPVPDPGHGGDIKPVLVPGPAVVPPRKPEKRRTALWGVLLVVAIAGAGTAYYLKQKADSAATSGGAAITVPTVAVSLGTVQATIRVTGTIAAENFKQLLAPRIMGNRGNLNRGGDFGGVGGRGAGGMMGGGGSSGGGGRGGGGGDFGGGGGPMGDFSLVLLSLSKPGTPVKIGDTVAQFDPQMQQQRLDDYRDSLIQEENNVKKMLANLAATKEAHDQQVRAAKAAWDRAVLDLKTAPVRSKIDEEKFKLTVEESEAAYKQLLYESTLVEESQRATIRASELNRDQSRLELQRTENNVQRMTMKSPMDGMVVMASIVRNGEFGQVREGDTVNAGQPFMTIVDPRSMVLNGAVNQVDAERLRLGMKASIRLDAYPDIELTGSLVGIGAMSKTSTFRASYVGEIPVRVKIDRTDPRLIPDLTASAEIVLSSETNAVVAPRAAVFDEDGATHVFVRNPEGWVRRKIDVGLKSFTNVAVRSGLQKGDVVALQRPI